MIEQLSHQAAKIVAIVKWVQVRIALGDLCIAPPGGNGLLQDLYRFGGQVLLPRFITDDGDAEGQLARALM